MKLYLIEQFNNLDGEKMTKMKKLLDVLSNPDARIPLGTLLKCEAALEAQLGSFKEQSVNVRFILNCVNCY